MPSTLLLSIIAEHEQAERGLAASYLKVWVAVSEAEPKLASELLALFSTTPEAALWLTTPLPELGASPARLVAQGQGAEVLSLVQKTMHGFVA